MWTGPKYFPSYTGFTVYKYTFISYIFYIDRIWGFSPWTCQFIVRKYRQSHPFPTIRPRCTARIFDAIGNRSQFQPLTLRPCHAMDTHVCVCVVALVQVCDMRHKVINFKKVHYRFMCVLACVWAWVCVYDASGWMCDIAKVMRYCRMLRVCRGSWVSAKVVSGVSLKTDRTPSAPFRAPGHHRHHRHQPHTIMWLVRICLFLMC